MDYMKIGSRIRRARRAKRYTLEYVGNYLGMGHSNVGKMERGERKPSIDIIEKLSIHFDCTMDYLLGKSDQPHLYEQDPSVAKKALELQEIITSLPEDERDEILKDMLGYLKIKTQK